MRVFISWSGETAQAIAKSLRDWLPNVIQALEPYCSAADVVPGARWPIEIANELDRSRIGVLCLTRDNLGAPWMMFEAGALSKHVGTAHVCPLLFGITPADLKGPLVQFQAIVFGKEEMRKLLHLMNDQLPSKMLEDAVLDRALEKNWPELEAGVAKILKPKMEPMHSEVRSERDLLEELLALVRTLSSLPPTSRQRPDESTSGLLAIISSACRSGKVELSYAPNVGPFAVYCETPDSKMYADFDRLQEMVGAVKGLFSSPEEQLTLESMTVRLYQIYHEIQATISHPIPKYQGR